MANLEVLALDTAVPQIRAPGAGDGYSVPRDMTMAGGTTLTAPTVNATTVDATNVEVTNVKAKDGTAAITIADSTGKITVTTELAVDNLNLSGNAITSTDSNGNIDLTPNGVGEVNITKVDIDAGAIDGTAVGANSASTGAFTTLSASSTATLSGLTASTALALDANKNIVSVTNTGTGNNVLATSPTLTTPVLGTPTSGNLDNCTADGTNKVGYRNIPQSGSDKTTSYSLATSDVGKFVGVGASGSITVPNNTFAAGDVISIFNNTTGNVTLTMSITTAYIAGTNTDKDTITLATRGVATILFISGTVCVVSGNVT